jgi:hypothetical protein
MYVMSVRKKTTDRSVLVLRMSQISRISLRIDETDQSVSINFSDKHFCLFLNQNLDPIRPRYTN